MKIRFLTVFSLVLAAGCVAAPSQNATQSEVPTLTPVVTILEPSASIVPTRTIMPRATSFPTLFQTPVPEPTGKPSKTGNIITNPSCAAEPNSSDIPGWAMNIHGSWANSFNKNPSLTGDACKKWPGTPYDALYQMISGPAAYFEITHIGYRSYIEVRVDGAKIWSFSGTTRVGSSGGFSWLTATHDVDIGPGAHLLEVYGESDEADGLKFLGITLR